MTAIISHGEIKLLAALHENSRGYGDGFAILAEPVRQHIELSPEEMSKAVSFLMGFGLVAAHHSTRDPKNGHMIYREIYLTALGENYMREVEERLNQNEEEPGMIKKLTLKSVQGGWSVIKVVAMSVLTDYVKRVI